MKRIFIPKFIALLLTTIVIICLSASKLRAASAGPNEDEEALMALFYEEDELVATSTRYPKPLSQVPEDVTIITAAEIAALNAHTLNEILIRLPGFLARSVHHDFGSPGYLYGNGLKDNHVLVLLDGVRFNNTSGGNALTNGIPVQIIKRIEIIKGPASSVWGSSLGGVVNIITKDVGKDGRTNGTASASYGEGASKDINLDLAGNHFYLYGGHQESDGLENHRFFDNDRMYGKLAFDLPYDMDLSLTLGHLEPQYSWGDFFSEDSRDIALDRNTFGSLNLDAGVAHGVNLHLAAQYFAMKFNRSSEALGLNIYYGNTAGVPLFERVWDEKTITGEARLAIERGSHTLVAGGEISRCKMDHIESYLPVYINSGWESPPKSIYVTNASELKWGVYINDSMKFGRLTLVPGIRFDHHSLIESVISPSLGMTMPLGQETIARLYLGRGFAYPPLSYLSGTFWDWWTGVGNRDLKPEKIWVVQGGIETNAVQYLHLVASIFHYHGEDFWQYTNTYPWFYANQYDGDRDGFSVEINTVPAFNLSALAGITYVYKSNSPTVPDPAYVFLKDDDIVKVDLALSYDDNRFARAKLMGMYVYWDKEVEDEPGYEYGDFLWDFVCGFKVYSTPKATVELFGTVHNLFNADHYTHLSYKNPGRWVEGGVKVVY